MYSQQSPLTVSSLFNERGGFDSHPSAETIITEYPTVLPTNHAVDWSTETLQTTPDMSWTLHDNALGLYEIYGTQSAWSADSLPCPSTTSIANPTDTQFHGVSLLHQPLSSDDTAHFWQPSTPPHPSFCGEVTLDRIASRETLIPHSVHTIPLPEVHPSRKSTTRSQGHHVGVSRSLDPRSSYTPYPLGSDRMKRGDFSYFHQCQWSEGARPCGAVVAGTKSAIGQHLRVAHAIRLKTDSTNQVCLWGKCQKPMRGESIARHVLAIHMQEKAFCPGCRMRFARTDSLQRHQRACRAKEVDTFDASEPGECHV